MSDEPNNTKRRRKSRLEPPEKFLELLKPDDHAFNEEILEKVLETYYSNRGSLMRTARELNISYHTLKTWKDKYDDFREKLMMVDDLIRDTVHDLFMGKVLDPDERNPAWRIFYLKKHDPRYSDKSQPLHVGLELTDSSVKKSEDKPGPEPPVEPEGNTEEVP
jgi:hypothetical protein